MNTSPVSSPTHPVSIGDATPPTGRTDATALAGRSDRITLAAGWSLLSIAALHTVVFVVNPWWGAWLSGSLFRSDPLPLEAMALFWALPGSFVVPLALLGAMVAGRGRRGQRAPGYVAPSLLGWAALCVWIVGPSGFLTALVPATLMIIARVRGRRRTD